jgi:hypothetical protein
MILQIIQSENFINKFNILLEHYVNLICRFEESNETFKETMENDNDFLKSVHSNFSKYIKCIEEIYSDYEVMRKHELYSFRYFDHMGSFVCAYIQSDIPIFDTDRFRYFSLEKHKQPFVCNLIHIIYEIKNEILNYKLKKYLISDLVDTVDLYIRNKVIK